MIKYMNDLMNRNINDLPMSKDNGRINTRMNDLPMRKDEWHEWTTNDKWMTWMTCQ